MSPYFIALTPRFTGGVADFSLSNQTRKVRDGTTIMAKV
jgi:hypothetical protein